MKQSPLPERVMEFLARAGPVSGPVVVAVSGGPDSVALARLLVSAQARGAVGKLILAHLNHQLRGEESAGDEDFVADLARRLSLTADVTCQSHRLDVRTLASSQGESLEKAGRDLRYKWLTAAAREAGAGWVATGHSADDHAETVLHRLLRGTGLRGLCGIPPRRPLVPGIEVIRPLLTTTRAEILDYLQAQKQEFRQDSSNVDVDYTRNRIRHELLPELASSYNPAIVSVLCRLSEQACDVQDHIEKEAARLLAEAELPRAGKILIFNVARLSQAPRHLIREVFRLAWRRENWPAEAMGFAEWDRLAACVHEGAVFDLPDGIRVCRRARVLQIGPQ